MLYLSPSFSHKTFRSMVFVVKSFHRISVDISSGSLFTFVSSSVALFLIMRLVYYFNLEKLPSAGEAVLKISWSGG